MHLAINRQITPDEREELRHWLADPANEAVVDQLFLEAWEAVRPDRQPVPDTSHAAILQQILRHESRQTPAVQPLGRYHRIRNIAAAACLLLVAAAGYFLLNRQQDSGAAPIDLNAAVVQAGIVPGTDKATITLGDGQTILLDSTGSGVLAEEGGIRLTRDATGAISYNVLTPKTAAPPAYHTVTVPKGGHFRLTLPDGSRVHLNAESTLQYPSRFADNERVITLQGEAYFEVTRRANTTSRQQTTATIPFIVRTPNQQVEVLGTAFNINAYDEHIVTTTLVEGAVKVSTEHSSAVLRPGERATNRKGNSRLQVETVHTDAELAWHNGYFLFNDEGIVSIMERVGRWYNVEVIYEGRLDDKRFGGVFQRSKSIISLLENFRSTGLVDFTITERRLIVREK